MSLKSKIALTIVLLIAVSALTSRGFDFITSVVPGWHTTIFPAFSYTVLLWGWFVIVITGCFVFLRNKVNRTNKTIYLSLTLPSLLIMTLITNGKLFLEGEHQTFIFQLIPLMLVCFLLYIIVQLWFMAVLIKAFVNR